MYLDVFLGKQLDSQDFVKSSLLFISSFNLIVDCKQ